MDLIELKKNYRAKNKMFVIVMFVIILLMISTFVFVPILLVFLPEDYFSENFIHVWGYSPFVVVIFFFTAMIWYTIKKERKRVEKIEYLYTKFASSTSNEGRHTYIVKSVYDLPKHYFRGLKLFRFTSVRCSLYMINPKTRHELYHVNFEQSNRSNIHIVSSGMIYSYPMSARHKVDHILSLLNANGFKAPLKTCEFKGQYLFYYEINQPIPVFKHFNEEEKKKFMDYSKIVFRFFDVLSDVFEKL